ncbi:unnamed protein product [Ceutorhynchus assimilis]|uniref:NADH dehydrogenase [ubiquinone] 1 beta subcomplex subunit 4 n=1 Tax=Ceutorhynchus assimilis TaxID=467358 RepID=A0A9N9MIB1_9CUCU|nr:unnamed protein product [Ceutorhynchus assimilis]
MSKVPQQLDASPEALEITEWKVQRRQQLREEFLKLKTDPFKHASGASGSVFDPAILRFQSIGVNYYDYFKPTGKMVLRGIGLIVVPMFGFAYLLKRSRGKIEASYRRGEVSYRDRNSKFV